MPYWDKLTAKISKMAPPPSRLLFSFLAFLIFTTPPSVCNAAKSPFVLRAWPNKVTAGYHHPIYINVALENVTHHDAYIRDWFTPVPFGPATDLHSMLMRCVDLKTGKEARYTGFPPGLTIDDASGKEPVVEVRGGCFYGATINLFLFCELTPGNYMLVMQYDTTFIPSWIKADKKAWHGVTNKVWVRIHISK